MYTTDLVESTDLPMPEVSNHSHHHLLGAVGQPSPVFQGFNTTRSDSPSQHTYAPHTAYHDGSIHHRIKHSENGSNASVEDDLSTLIAHAHKQRELDKARRAATIAVDGLSGVGSQVDNLSLGGSQQPRKWTEEPVASSRYDNAQTYGLSAGGLGQGNGNTIGNGHINVNANGKGNGTVRFDDDHWDRATASLTTHRGTSLSPVNQNNHNRTPDPLSFYVPPKTAPLPTFQPFSDSAKLPPLISQPSQVPGHPHTAALTSQAELYYASPDRAIFARPPSTSPASAPAAAVASVPVNHDFAADISRHLEGLSKLIDPFLTQNGELDKARKEIEMWKREWSEAQNEIKRLQGAVAKPKIGPTFTAVLIDGDGLIFQDSLISQGFLGGQKAAHSLLTALPTLAASSASSPLLEVKVEASGAVSSNGETISNNEGKELGSVVVQIFLNKAGLGTALTKTGLIPSLNKYEAFWQGFSSSHELFTVCDVGVGKEATDAKIREYLKLYTRNAQCEMIVLGASHDNGYANVLSSLQTESRLSKLLLLKGYKDLAGQLKQYSSRVVSIPDLFRTTKIPPIPTTFSSVVKESAVQPKSSPPTTAPAIKPKSLKEAVGTPQMSGEVIKKKVKSPSSEDEIETIEWSTISQSTQGKGKADGSGSGSTYASHKNNKKFKGSVVNEDDDGGTESDEWQTLKGKKDKKKKKQDQLQHQPKYTKFNKHVAEAVRALDPRPCHTYYLSPWGCKNDDECKYGHDYDLNQAQLDVLAKLAKSIMCPYILSDKCRYSDDECVYGHRCPNPDNCTYGDTCRFYAIPNGHGELDG
ncbi:hypothetical protein I317_05422 [Kwoniella heveanensis CBS 569]|nr:hypothetical protein I317_05422 [Kwoniella heveanensis CBS 569]